MNIVKEEKKGCCWFLGIIVSGALVIESQERRIPVIGWLDCLYVEDARLLACYLCGCHRALFVYAYVVAKCVIEGYRDFDVAQRVFGSVLHLAAYQPVPLDVTVGVEVHGVEPVLLQIALEVLCHMANLFGVKQ